jgi:protein-tyrosine phosphatase
MGNICRSPMAEGVLRLCLSERAPERKVFVDSAGTHGYHAGSPPDPRAQTAAGRRGVPIEQLRARRVEVEDFEIFDLLLAMDLENLAHLQELAPQGQAHKARLLLEYSVERRGGEVPDPYYGGETGFERVLDMLEEAMDGLLPEIERLTRGSRSP